MMRVLTLAAAASVLGLASVASAQGPQPVARTAVAAQIDTAFAAADTNHDGVLNVAEMQALQAKETQGLQAALRAQAEARFKQLDTNKDGQLSLAEFYAAIPSVKANQTAQQLIQQLDANHDGKLSVDEFKTPRLAQFDRADANHDGTLTPAEAQAAQGKK